MRKYWFWILLLALATTLVYWLTRSAGDDAAKNDFPAPLPIGEELPQVLEIQPCGGAPYQLTREEGQWLISFSDQNREAQPDSVARLLRSLEALRISGLVAHGSSAWPEYGLQQERATRVEVNYSGKAPSVIWINCPAFSAEEGVYLRLPGEEEVFEGFGLSPAWLAGSARRFQQQPLLLTLTDPEDLQRIRLQTSERDIELRKLAPGRWKRPDSIIAAENLRPFFDSLPDLLRPTAYYEAGAQPSLDDPILTLEVTDFSGTATESIRLFQDSLTAAGFLLQSSRFPNECFPLDSAAGHSLLEFATRLGGEPKR